jgi:hypothetical protein
MAVRARGPDGVVRHVGAEIAHHRVAHSR